MKLRTMVTVGSLVFGAWRAMHRTRKTVKRGLKRAARAI